MNCVNHLVTESLPGYLKGLPIPNTVCCLIMRLCFSCPVAFQVLGWFSLSVGDWARLIPFGVAVGGLSYLSLQVSKLRKIIHIIHLRGKYCKTKKGMILSQWLNPQGLAHSPVVGPFLREKLTILPGMQVFLKNM